MVKPLSFFPQIKYWVFPFIIIVGCEQKKNKASEANRIEYIRALVRQVGIQQLPFTYDLAKKNPDSRRQVDRSSMDTLFFDDLNGSVGGVLPDTLNYYGFIYYKVGDLLYPYLVTVDKKGDVIDRQLIGIGNCGGLA